MARMYVVDTNEMLSADEIHASVPVLKRCPFCYSNAKVATAYEPTRYGIHCPGCAAGFLPVLETEREAVARWNRRAGTVSAAGGRATRGLTSRRKAAAARRNLRKAREQKQLNALKREITARLEALRSNRQEMEQWVTAQTAESRQRLKKLLDELRDHPACSDLVREIEETWGSRLGLRAEANAIKVEILPRSPSKKSMGSAGDSPVPSGDSPDGMTAARLGSNKYRPFLS
ncbi:MAG: Lar family restriction alleviation protein, partial [Verrucomicrobiota bacterium]